MDCKGRWRLGPLHGQWQKACATFIGEGARQEARRQKERELKEQIKELEASQKEIRDVLQALNQNLKDLDAEVARVPNHQPLRDRLAHINAAQRQLAQASERFQASKRHVSQHRQAFDQAQAAWQQDRQDLLMDQIQDLHQCLEDTLNYERSTNDLCHLLEKHIDRLQRLDERNAQTTDARNEHERLKAISLERQNEATRPKVITALWKQT